jgi:hypothetical protein
MAPLEDPRYEPKHPPRGGYVPAVIDKWGPRSQLRWFVRFRRQLNPLPTSERARYYCDSLDHRGWCCDSCMDDWGEGYSSPPDGTCCCKGLKP